MHFYLKISRFFLYLVPLSVFIVTPQTLFPFIVGKYSFFRLMVGLAFIFFMLAWGSGKAHINWEILKRPISIGVIIWVAVFLLSVLFAYDPWAAFWGNFERGEAGIQLLFFLIFFFLILNLFRTKEDWETFLKYIITGSVLVIIYGLLAGRVNNFVGPAFSLNTRFQGSLGNPDYIGQYMLFSVFFALFILLTHSLYSRKTNLTYGFFALLFFLTFIFSQTRGAFLGFVAAILAFLFCLLFSTNDKKQKLIFGIILLALILSIFVFFILALNHFPFLRNIPVLGRFADFSFESIKGRLYTWETAFWAIKDRPIFGWGPENFSFAFDKYFNYKHFHPGQGGETWFDRAHSVILDYAASTGIIGLLAYLAVFVLYYFQFFKSEFNNLRSLRQLFVSALFFALPFGYLITGLTLFDVYPIYLMLFSFLALANYTLSIRDKNNAIKVKNKN